MIAADEPLVRWDWIGSHLGEIWDRTVEHVTLTVAAVGIGLVISGALAVVARRYRRSYGPITWFTGVLYTIPSLAMFSLLIPFTGLSTTTALIPLVTYTLFILIRNIVAGLDAVPASVINAAEGMGYTPFRRLVRVELPLALPTIIAGLRIASVTIVGLVGVAAFVGYGGYGALILDGLDRFFPTPTMVGAVLSVVLALVFDLIFVLVGRVLTPWRRAA